MASNGYQRLTLANIANTCWIGNKSETINQGYLLGEAIGSEKLRDALDGCTWLRHICISVSGCYEWRDEEMRGGPGPDVQLQVIVAMSTAGLE